jgi:hypothetical protein
MHEAEPLAQRCGDSGAVRSLSLPYMRRQVGRPGLAESGSKEMGEEETV